jgi:hypothetical protein
MAWENYFVQLVTASAPTVKEGLEIADQICRLQLAKFYVPSYLYFHWLLKWAVRADDWEIKHGNSDKDNQYLLQLHYFNDEEFQLFIYNNYKAANSPLKNLNATKGKLILLINLWSRLHEDFG